MYMLWYCEPMVSIHEQSSRISVNTRPHQLCLGDQEMVTAISCMECSQVASLIQKIIHNDCNRHMLLMHKRKCLHTHSEVLEVQEVPMDKIWFE